MSFFIILLQGACWQVFEDLSAFCGSFVWEVPW